MHLRCGFLSRMPISLSLLRNGMCTYGWSSCRLISGVSTCPPYPLGIVIAAVIALFGAFFGMVSRRIAAAILSKSAGRVGNARPTESKPEHKTMNCGQSRYKINHKITGVKPMPEYRRVYVPGGTYFLALVTYNRTPLFSKDENISRLRSAVADVKSEMPFSIEGAVVLPDHIHFLWTLPSGDTNYSKRVGRLKVLFTHALRGQRNLPQNVSASRRKHRGSDSRLLRIRVSLFMWQRRFFQHYP